MGHGRRNGMSSWLEGRVTLLEGESFRATNATGQSIVLESASAGVERQGVSPMEVVLLGLGGCTGMDVISTLRKMRQDVAGYEVRVRGERREEHPRIYTLIEVEHVLTGRGLRANAVERAIALSAGKYCSVSTMLEQSAKVEITYRLVDADTGGETSGAVDVQAVGVHE
jgi:putative redox protein